MTFHAARRTAVIVGLVVTGATQVGSQSGAQRADIPFAGVYFDEPRKLLEPFENDLRRSCLCVEHAFELKPRVFPTSPFGPPLTTDPLHLDDNILYVIRQMANAGWNDPWILQGNTPSPRLLIIGLGTPPFGGEAAVGAAVQEYLRLAQDNDRDAQAELGYLYAVGLGVPQDDRLAGYWYGQAAMKDHRDAQIALAAMYLTGRGVPVDERAAAYWLWRSRNPQLLGDVYACGVGVPQNVDYARQMYQAAAERGTPEAQYQLGDMYFDGCGVPLDDTTAKKWFLKAANSGHPDAQVALSEMEGRGLGLLANPWQAYVWAAFALVRLPDDDPLHARAVAARDHARAAMPEFDYQAALTHVQAILEIEDNARANTIEQALATLGLKDVQRAKE